jgi:hypothetical protein
MQQQHNNISAKLQLRQQWGAQQQLDSGDAGLLPAALVEVQYEAAATVAEPTATPSVVPVSDSSLSHDSSSSSSSSSGLQDDGGDDSLDSYAQQNSHSGALSGGLSVCGSGDVNVPLPPSCGGAWAPWAGCPSSCVCVHWCSACPYTRLG